IALAAALAAGGVLAIATRGRAMLRSRVFVVSASGAALATVALLLSPTGRRLILTGPPLDSRTVIWEGTLRAFLARPILGWGPDGLATGFGSVRPLGMEDIYIPGELIADQAHDWILQALATTGIVGGAVLVVMVGAFAVTLFRQRRGPLAVLVWPLMLASLTYWMNALSSPDSVSIGWIPWVMFAATAWMVARAPSEAPVVRALPRWAIGAVMFGSVAIAATGWNVYRANVELPRAAAAHPPAPNAAR